MKIFHRGKVKDIYKLSDDLLLFHFSDRVSAFDVKIKTPIPKKGEVLCKFAEFWFGNLKTDHHMIHLKNNKDMLVKRLDMIPIECVVRGYFYGSLIDRYKTGDKTIPIRSSFTPVLAAKLPEPMFDPTTKSEKHDSPITEEKIISLGLLNQNEYDYIKAKSLSLYDTMKDIVNKANFILADVKFEFGRDPKTGKIVLGDSLGPDEYRLWLKSNYSPGKIQESYDKQLLRDWLIKTGFKKIVYEYARQGRKPPSPPDIPQGMVNKLSNRYVFAYETITGHKLN
jgi:phosphoribosylaminoimidazole-succinocarboxamide synthase